VRAPACRGGSTLVLATLWLSVAAAAGGSAQLLTQADSIRHQALVVAQTRPDSARAMVRRLLASLAPSDSLYPGVLLTASRLASDAPTVATYLQRVVIEYGRSVWADSALLLLAQLDFAQGQPSATVRDVERMERDYPDSPLRPRAAFWGARAYFDLKDDPRGCALVQQALAGAGDDVEFKNQVLFYAARCSGGPPSGGGAGTPVSDSARAAPGPPTYSVQVLAVGSAPQVDDVLSRLKVMGFEARVVRDTSGLFKVRVGRYATRAEAQRAERVLKAKLGGRPFIVEEP
jgi:SPOR domain